MSGTSFQGAVGVGDGTSGIVVEMRLNVTADHTAESSDQIINLSWRGTTDCVCDTDAVDTNLVDGGVNLEKIDEVGAERVFGGESDFDVV